MPCLLTVSKNLFQQRMQFCLQGGFRGWTSAGLPVKASPDYDASDLDVLSDKIQGQVIPSLRYATSCHSFTCAG